MNVQLGTSENVPEKREKRSERLPAVSLVFFFITTTVFDVRIVLMTGSGLLDAILLPGLIFIQGYVVWYYFNRFRPARGELSIYGPEIVASYSWLFVLATIGTSVVALIGFYLLR